MRKPREKAETECSICWLEQSSSGSDDEDQTATAPTSTTCSDRPHSWIYEQEPLYRRYRQLHLIGVGKYSKVYAGEDVVTKQEVALKIVDRKKLTDEHDAREEYKKVSALCHRNIVNGLAFFRSSPEPHLDTIVITRINGVHFFENITHKLSSESEVKTFFKQIINAIEYLISQKVVHGDIKPENVLVDNGNSVCLIDFGHSLPDPEFSAPEVHSCNFSHPCDIWSVGVLMYAALSGVSPFLDDCLEETIANKCNANFSFPAEYFGGTSESAQDLISQIFESNPDQRPSPCFILGHRWFQEEESEWVVPRERLRNFTFRRKKSVYGGL